MKVERRRKLTRAEWRAITSARPVVRRIPPPEKPHTSAPMRAWLRFHLLPVESNKRSTQTRGG